MPSLQNGLQSDSEEDNTPFDMVPSERAGDVGTQRSPDQESSSQRHDSVKT